MRKRGRSSAGRWALGALLVVALVGGVAWADSQSVAVHPGATVVAVLVPGSDGAVFSDGPEKGDGHLDFNIGGQIEVNGEVAVAYDSEEEYTITLKFHEEAGFWMVDTTIEDANGPVFMQHGYPLESMPNRISATGEDVISLSAE